MPNFPDPFIPRRIAASEISERLFPVTERALRDWREPHTVIMNGRACARRSEWFEAARQRLVNACYGQDPDRHTRLAKARSARRAVNPSVAPHK